MAKELSQKETAENSEVTQGQYSRIENGKVEPSLSTLLRIAETLGTPLKDLFITEESPEEMTLTEKLKSVQKMHDRDKEFVLRAIDLTLFASKSLENADVLAKGKS